MPFGIYDGKVLIDLPEEYLFWFTRHGFPEGELGRLMQLCLELKVEGLDSLIKPLKKGERLGGSNAVSYTHLTLPTIA